MLYIPSSIHRLGLDANSLRRLSEASKKADEMEKKFMRDVAKMYRDLDEEIEETLMKKGELPEPPDFAELIVRNASAVAIVGYKQAETEDELETRPRKRLAKKKIPKPLEDLMKAWDTYRKTGKLPKRQRALADSIKKEYLQKVKDVWEKYSTPFRSGDVQTKEEIVKKVQEAARTTQHRASTIVQTETTRHYNQARVAYYDQSDDVSHYLFVAIRDHATTKWCRTRQGLVFTKGTDVFEKETPPIHWNCRSEILPLTPLNPYHKKLINDSSLRRENHSCEPLPKGWNS